MAGGSESRCVELANGIARHTNHEAFILCEELIHPRILHKVDPVVPVTVNLLRDSERAGILYDMDIILVVNSSRETFTDVKYWRGETKWHRCAVDLSRIRKLVFLFNFTLAPAAKLPSLLPEVPNLMVLTANTRFLEALSWEQDYEGIRHLPRMMLPSPIGTASVPTSKTASDQVRVGQYSLPWVGADKFNPEEAALVQRINDTYSHRVAWRFMGMPEAKVRPFRKYPNVTIERAFAVPVREFLRDTDVFVFYPSWSLSEPWSRSVAEALMSGCPVLTTATAGGNHDQVVQGSNGYLCRDLDEFAFHLGNVIQRPALLRTLGRNALLYSRFFRTQHVVEELIRFIS